MAECRYWGMCRLEFAADFDVCYPCVGDGSETCFHYEPMPDVRALTGLAQEINDTSCDNHGELSVSLGDIWGWSQAIRDALGGSDG